MKRKFFIKKLILFLLALIIPLVLLGSVSIYLSRHYVDQGIDMNNSNLLRQVKDSIEISFNEFDNMILNYEVNTDIVQILKSVFNSESMSYDSYKSYRIIQSYLYSSVNSKPYIHSVFIYYKNNRGRYFSSLTGLSYLDFRSDEQWYTDFIYQHLRKDIWVNVGKVDYLGTRKDPVISLCKNLFSSGAVGPDGIIVLNIQLSYIRDLIQKISVLPEQNIVILDKSGNIVLQKNGLYTDKVKSLASQLLDKSSDTTTFRTDDFSITSTASDRYGWTYVSILPESMLYKVSSWIQTVMLLVLLASLVTGILLALYITSVEYARLNSILDILSRAESDRPLPPPEAKAKDEYGYIIQNILKTFLEQNYLKLQLSQRKFEQKTLELLALQSQMNPHFLFNTLETINWRIVALNGLDCDASIMLQNLSDVLKYSLGSSDEYVALSEEIVNTNSYIQILKARYHDKFSVKWQYDRELEHLKAIKLLIQPLIENSVYHGIKEKAGRSSIKIKIQMTRFDRLRITVIDNGLGIKKSRLEEIRSDLEAHKRSDTHIGLFNTNRRLILAYGEEFPLKLKSKYGFGTVVYIEIPIT